MAVAGDRAVAHECTEGGPPKARFLARTVRRSLLGRRAVRHRGRELGKLRRIHRLVNVVVGLEHVRPPRAVGLFQVERQQRPLLQRPHAALGLHAVVVNERKW